MSDKSPKGLFGLTAAEQRDLKTGLRYGGTIVLAVVITFLVLAFVTSAIGYPPAGSSPVAEVTPEATAEATSES